MYIVCVYVCGYIFFITLFFSVLSVTHYFGLVLTSQSIYLQIFQSFIFRLKSYAKILYKILCSKSVQPTQVKYTKYINVVSITF